jgi:hypothetical protein
MDDRCNWERCPLKALMQEKEEKYQAIWKAMDKALRIAEDNTQHWRANANEWRQAMDDRERNFLSHNMGIVIGILSATALIIAIADRFVR